jgi:hypothetical protein
MFDEVNEIAIIVTALLGIAIGSIWYSPLVFGKYWMSAARLTKEDLAMSRASLVRSIGYASIANIVFVYIVARLIGLVAAQDFPLAVLGVLLILFLVTSMTSVVVWEKKSFVYLMIHAGYGSIIVCISILVLAFWPW